MAFRFLHTADIHLDSPLVGLEQSDALPIDQIRGATRRAFEHLVDFAIDEQVAFLLIAGDLYDGEWKDFNTGIFFNRKMAQLKAAGIPVVIVQGNHDAASQITKNLRPPDNVRFLSSKKPETFALQGLDVRIHGRSYAQRAVSDDLTQHYPNAEPGCFNIGLLHTSLNGREGHEPYAPCTLDSLRSKGYQYWALGHIHRREVVLQQPWIVFPGNLQGRHILETGPKGCTLITVESQEVTKVESVVLDVLRWQVCPVDVSDCRLLDEVYERAQAAFVTALTEADGRPVVVRLELIGATPLHQRLRAQAEHLTEELRSLALSLGGEGVWLERVKHKTSEPGQLASLVSADEALGGLVNNLANLTMQPDILKALDPDMDAFLNRLPHELRSGTEAFDPFAVEQCKEILADTKGILLAALLGQGTQP